MSSFCYYEVMSGIEVEILKEHVHKYSTNPTGYKRLQRELKILDSLQESKHIPVLIRSEDKNGRLSIYMENVTGTNGKQLIGMRGNEYVTQPITWSKAKERIKQYIQAEMDLLTRRYLYRDLNLEHLIFSTDKVVFVDLESTIGSMHPDNWNLCDMRGTWETMAPEEFRGYGRLTARTATYRAAIVSHLILTGRLPFRRFPASRSTTHHWRNKHPAEINPHLSRATRRVFRSALARQETQRHKNPENFFKRLAASLN